MTDKIKELAEIMKANDLTEIEYENGSEKLKIKRKNGPEHPPVPPMFPGFGHPGFMGGMPGPNVPGGINAGMQGTDMSENKGEQSFVSNVSSESGKIVKTPLVGTFYAAPGVDKEPYVKVGDHVKKGQIIGIVEAMKLMNEIESDADGVVTEILVENGRMVEFGQGLIRLN